MKDESGPQFTLAEITPGETALCLREGNTLHIIREHMTPSEAVSMLRDVLTGKITQEELTTKYQWRTIDISQAGFKGAAQVQLPPVKDWKPRK